MTVLGEASKRSEKRLDDPELGDFLRLVQRFEAPLCCSNGLAGRGRNLATSCTKWGRETAIVGRGLLNNACGEIFKRL